MHWYYLESFDKHSVLETEESRLSRKCLVNVWQMFGARLPSWHTGGALVPTASPSQESFWLRLSINKDIFRIPWALQLPPSEGCAVFNVTYLKMKILAKTRPEHYRHVYASFVSAESKKAFQKLFQRFQEHYEFNAFFGTSSGVVAVVGWPIVIQEMRSSLNGCWSDYDIIGSALKPNLRVRRLQKIPWMPNYRQRKKSVKISNIIDF